MTKDEWHKQVFEHLEVLAGGGSYCDCGYKKK